jgi:hypothetical protein
MVIVWKVGPQAPLGLGRSTLKTDYACSNRRDDGPLNENQVRLEVIYDGRGAVASRGVYISPAMETLEAKKPQIYYQISTIVCIAEPPRTYLCWAQEPIFEKVIPA